MKVFQAVVLLLILGVSVAAAANLWEWGGGEAVRVDDSVDFLGRHASAAEMAQILGLEIWRFDYRPNDGSTSLLVQLRLREPGKPVRTFGHSSTYYDHDPSGLPGEIVVALSTRVRDGKTWLQTAEIRLGSSHRSAEMEIPFGLSGRVPTTPHPIGEHEYAIRWQWEDESGGGGSNDEPDLARDTIWSIYLGPVPEDMLPREQRAKE